MLTLFVSIIRSRLSGRGARGHRRLCRHSRGRGRSPAMARRRGSPGARGPAWVHARGRGHPGAGRGRHPSWREPRPRGPWRHVRPAPWWRRHRSHGVRAGRARGQRGHGARGRHWRGHVASGAHHVRRRRHRVDAGHGGGGGVSEQLVGPVSLGQRVLGGQETLGSGAVPLSLRVLLECVGNRNGSVAQILT